VRVSVEPQVALPPLENDPLLLHGSFNLGGLIWWTN
jgi:hypothetical protein